VVYEASQIAPAGVLPPTFHNLNANVSEIFVSQHGKMPTNSLKLSLHKTFHMFVQVLPIILGMLLLTSLAITAFPKEISAGFFSGNPLSDAIRGAVLGSIAAGHPLASYILGGELLSGGVSLFAVTALIVSWVTVGIVQLPAEVMFLGKHFAVLRNMLNFFFAVIIALFIVTTMQILAVWLP
jgi:hypothetical protein